ncbi:MAG: hypothetical protein J3R72DRAFT_496710 [Linnemannia gamsii]|nr:MAG: hypothetical protein J3R72DRAFT_496710 [Linnemannia gamsii]
MSDIHTTDNTRNSTHNARNNHCKNHRKHRHKIRHTNDLPRRTLASAPQTPIKNAHRNNHNHKTYTTPRTHSHILDQTLSLQFVRSQ